MGDQIKQTVTIKEIVDVRDAIKGIQEIQDALGKLAVPSNMREGFDKIFSNMENQIEKANKAMASGFKTKGSVEAYSNAMTQIVNLYGELTRKIDHLNNEKIVLKADDASFKKLVEEVDTLNRKIDKTEEKIERLKGLKTIESLGSKTGNKVGSWDAFIKAYKDGDIEGATKALKVLKGLWTKHTKDEDFGPETNWANFEKDYITATKRLKELDVAQQEYTKNLNDKNQKEQEAAKLVQNAANAHAQAKNNVQKGAEEAKKFAKETTEAAGSTQQLNSELERFKSKAAYFFGLSNAINLFKRAVRSAYDTVKDLDAVMTETAVVTDFSVGDMWSQLPEYTQRANELGVTIHDTYEAATLFYQQGLKTNEVMQISNETLKMARIAGLDAATASDRMTNALRGFNMELDKTSAQRVNDVYSKLAAITASNTDEISTAMTKVASLAHNANMEFETTAAFLAQIIESTRESAETAGTALKTVVARFSEVKKLYSKGELMGSDEEGEEIDVNKVSTALRSAGINLNEYLTGAKGLDDIFIELAGKWDSLDQVQQRYIATMAAGSRQQSRFIALMSDYGRTTELVSAANNANGASQEQYSKTLESLQTKLARLKNAWNEFILGLANSDAIKKAVDLLTSLITTINNLIKTISGKNAGAKMITTFITAFTTFKVGQSIFNKGAFGGLFSQLMKFGTGAAGEAGANTAKIFYSKLADKLIKYSKGGGVIGSIEKAEANLGNKFNSFFTADASFMESSLFDKSGLKQEEFTEFWNKLDKGNLTVEQLNKALKDAGSNLQIDATNAEQFGIKWKGNNTVIGQGVLELKQASAAAMALGSAFILVGNILEKEGGEWEVFGKVIKTLGAGLMVFGTIMSVWLPLQVQLGAKGISAAIYNIPIIGWITLVISLVVSLGVALASIAKNNSAETKLQKAAEAAENAAQAAEDAKKAFNELNEAWSKLDDKYAVIENATKGTTEWKNAVKELNDQVLELMNTYKGIHIERDKDGILKITNREEYTEKQRQNTLEADAAARFSKIREYNRDQDVRYKKLNHNDPYWGEAEGYKPLIEKAIKEGYLEKLAEATDEEIMDLYKVTPSTSEIVYADNEISRPGLGKAVRDYAKNYKENQAGIKSQYSALGSTILQNADIDKDVQKYVNTFLSDEYLKKLTEKNQKTYESLWDNEAKAKYAKNKGYNNWNSYVSEHQEDKDTTAAQLKDRMASADALNEATNQVRIFANNLEKLDSYEQALFGEQGGGGLTKAQANNLNRYSDDQIREIYDNLGGDKAFGQDGFKNYFKEWFRTTVDEAASNFKVEDKYGKEFSDKLSESLTEDLDSESFKSFTENMWSVVTASGYEGMKELQDSLTKITEKIEPVNRRGFISSLKQIDWTSSNSIHTLSNLAKEYGISENEADKLEKQIIKLNKASAKVDLTKATEQIKSLLGISKKVQIGSQGRSFTEEQVKQLTEAGMDASKFQYNIETGQYDYTGVLDDIRKAVNKLVEETFDTEQLEKDVASSKAANEAIDSEKENTTDYGKKAELVDNYIKAAGENSKINKKWFDYASSEASKGNFEILDKLVAIVEKEAGEYLNRKNTLEGAALNKDVMMHQLNSGNKNAHLANNGDLAATKALEGQVSSSNMSEELKQKLLSGMDGSLEGGYGRMQYKEMAGNMVDTFDQAKAYGIENTELEAYAKSLQQVNGLEKLRIDNLYQLSLAEINYQKGQQSLYDTQEQWSKLINKKGQIIPDGTIEQAKIYSKLKQDIKQMLNLSEDLPDSFLKSKTNVDLLKKAVKGNKDAVEKLRTAAAKVQLKNIDIKDKDLKDKITNKIDELSKEMPDLKIGATLDSTDAGKDLMDFVNKAGMSVEDIQKLFNSLGWAPDIKWKDISYDDAQKIAQTGTVYQLNKETGKYEEVKLDGSMDIDQSQSFAIPQIGPKTAKVASKPPKKNPPKKKKGGGGKKSKAKKERWENPYDELYNLQEKINEALRTREALERRYQKLLKQEQTSLSDIRKSYYDQIKQIRYEANLQKELEAGRRRQINNIGKETYVDSKGKVKTFDQMGVTKYAKFNFETGEIEMDWAGIQALEGTKNVEKGKAVEAYVSKLQELVQSYEEVRDKLWELEDKIEEYRQAVIDTFLSFEDRVLDAVVNKYQKEIDNYQAMSDAIDKVNNEVLKSLREQVDLSRQIRDNTKKEEDISKKENRLAYLQRDTSGANDLEILNLQKELKDARESYSDELIDQAIDKMQDDADKASEQRQRQIEIMQTQLDIARDTGALWDEVYDLMNKASESEIFSEDSELAKLLKDGEAFKALSNIGQAKWWEEVGTAFRQAIIGRDEAEDKYKKDADNNGTVANTGTSDYLKEIDEMNTQANVTPNTYERTDEQNYGAAAAIVMGGKTHGGWGAKNTDWASNLKEKGFDSGLVLDLVEVFNTQKAAWDKEQAAIQKAKGKYKKGKKKGKWKYTVNPWTGWKTMGVTDWKKYQMSQFKTGGLADSTGPAWLDGTKTKPELVLNAQDTKNFITLKDILASLMGGQSAGPTTKGGDNYFDINISADIGSDYDVDRLASRIKKQIYEDGQYRNVNTINFLR